MKDKEPIRPGDTEALRHPGFAELRSEQDEAKAKKRGEWLMTLFKSATDDGES